MQNCGMRNAEGKMRNGMCGATVIGMSHHVTEAILHLTARRNNSDGIDSQLHACHMRPLYIYQYLILKAIFFIHSCILSTAVCRSV